jgi:predicted nucleic acid-binding protein
MTLVVDAGVAAKWFIEEAGRAQALRLLDVPDRQAPDLLIAEVGNIKNLRNEANHGPGNPGGTGT